MSRPRKDRLRAVSLLGAVGAGASCRRGETRETHAAAGRADRTQQGRESLEVLRQDPRLMVLDCGHAQPVFQDYARAASAGAIG